ncbi:hypothetical protein [Peterkaempfera sp. SMS 1(5)a]|uniref:hypothetical protein n=1 Tax=Peterkaempfera podocarpi TaxID=3232308 RepID=UPI00366A5670
MSEEQPPPGWPSDVYRAGVLGWEQTAMRWLWQWVPPGYRRYELLHRGPALLGQLARHEVAASLDAARRCRAVVRTELSGVPAAEPIERVEAVFAEEERRLTALLGQVELVAAALVHAARAGGSAPGQ